MFFKFFKRKKKEDVSKEQIEGDRRDILGDGSLSKQELKAFKNDEYRNKKISDICNQILESNKLVKEDIIKFTVLSDKINDIDKIKRASSERRQKLSDMATKVESLENERQKYEKASDTLALDTAHYLILERNEYNILNEIK